MKEQAIKLPFDISLLPVQRVYAGELSCIYERGNLRYIKYGDVEILKIIYGAVRNENWETASYEIEVEEWIERTEKSFVVKYTAIYTFESVCYKAHFTIEGKEDSSISFSMKGEALCRFEKNRIGLCVHHPIAGCAGNEVEIEQSDGTKYTAVFPVHISPHQPFTQVYKMTWAFEKDGLAQLAFEGDVFETEDQRNWTDHSYKTYGTPLYLPKPVAVSKGEKTEQHIYLKIIKSHAAKQGTEAVSKSAAEEKVLFPKLGYCRVSGTRGLIQTEMALLNALPFDHYRVVLHLSSFIWKSELHIAASEAKTLNGSLELVLFFTASFVQETEDLMEAIAKLPVKSILPLHPAHKTTPLFLIQHVYSRVKYAFPAIAVGYGTDGFFAELNREKPFGCDFDFVSFTMHPQVHATDTRTIIENLQSQRQLVQSIRQFTRKPIHVSPITFQERHDMDDSMKMKKDADTRLHTFFGAAWTLWCIKNLSQAAHLTFFQTTGERGVLYKTGEVEQKPPPLYNMLAQLKAFNPQWILNNDDQREISFMNKAGDLLTFSLPHAFIDASGF